jgi:DNA-directed RNA polymerase subunit RPC12/RpoP
MAADEPNVGPRCDHCGVPISDPTTQRVHGARTFCCANCSQAMEQHGPGTDPDSTRSKNDLRCSHCSAPIVDETTMESRGDQAFCCRNCVTAHANARV